MSEKRKPDITLLLKNEAKKTYKIELFSAEKFKINLIRNAKRYRLRINGKWFGKKGKGAYKDVYTFYQIKNAVWDVINRM
jgi:hypothetical protein